MLIQCGALDAIKTLSSTLISGLFVLSRVPLNSARKLRRSGALVSRPNPKSEFFSLHVVTWKKPRRAGNPTFSATSEIPYISILRLYLNQPVKTV